jgi:hypothetical protein
LEENVEGRDALSDELLLTQVRGRRWVHDITLVEKGAATEVASDLPDNPVGGGKLGKKGQRRFAPSTGRRRAEFETIQPVQWGEVWLKIGQEKLEMYRARVSFVLKGQSDHVERAYQTLSNRDAEDDE